MDPRFLKWLSEMLALWAENLTLWEKMRGESADFSEWFRVFASFPGVSPPPAGAEKMEDFFREWLKLWGAVPRSECEELRKKVASLEAEVLRLRGVLEGLSQGLSAVSVGQEVMKPWMELAQKALKTNLDWFAEHQSSPGKEPGGSET